MSHIFGRKQAPVKTLAEASAPPQSAPSTAVPSPAPSVVASVPMQTSPAATAPVQPPPSSAPSAPPVDPGYAARLAERDKNLADWATQREVPTMTDRESDAVLATFDAEPDVWIKWYHISAKEQLAMVNRISATQRAQMIGEYNGAFGRHVGVPPGWVGSACHKLRGD